MVTKKRVLGTFLFLVGSFFLLSLQFTITGNVVSETFGKIGSSIIGSIFILGGLGLFISGKNQYTVKSLESLLKTDLPAETVFVIDSSGAIDYQDKIEKIVEEYPNGVFVPEKIQGELKNNKMLMKKFANKVKLVDAKNYKGWKKVAQEELEKTTKHQQYLVLKDIFLEKIPFGSLKKREMKPYEDEMIKVIGYVTEKLKGKTPMKEELLDYLEKHYKVSDGDVDVLATALTKARERKNVEVLAHDSHIGEAISTIKDKFKRLGKYLNYLDYRIYAPKAV